MNKLVKKKKNSSTNDNINLYINMLSRMRVDPYRSAINPV